MKQKDSDSSLNDEIKHEVNLMASLDHLNVVKYYGAGSSGAFFWIVMVLLLFLFVFIYFYYL